MNSKLLDEDLPGPGKNDFPGLGCLQVDAPSEATVGELETLSADAFRYDKLSDDFDEKAKEARIKRDEVAARIKQVLTHFGKTKYDSNYGTIEIRTKNSFKTPKTPEQKKAFFEYLQSKGIFWEYVSVNANSLNSFCGQEYEAAKEEGKECAIPGIENPTEYQTIAYRSKK